MNRHSGRDNQPSAKAWRTWVALVLVASSGFAYLAPPIDPLVEWLGSSFWATVAIGLGTFSVGFALLVLFLAVPKRIDAGPIGIEPGLPSPDSGPRIRVELASLDQRVTQSQEELAEALRETVDRIAEVDDTVRTWEARADARWAALDERVASLEDDVRLLKNA